MATRSLEGARAHLVPVPGAAGWSLWRAVCVRGAGFPADAVDRLSTSPDVLSSIDEQIGEESSVERLRRQAIDACQRVRERPGGDERVELERALKKLRSNRVPDGLGESDPQAARAVNALRAAANEVEGRRGVVREAFERDAGRIRRLVRDIIQEPRFREALLWQNRRAYNTGIAAILRQPVDATDRDTRRNELTVATYLQRYCVKNETIGFFGPVGWGTLREDGEPISVRPGTSLLANRTVYFEHWTVDTLAARMARDEALRPWLVPRRWPRIRLQGALLFSDSGPSQEIPPPYAYLLAACDGERPARAVAQGLVADPRSGFETEGAVFELLAEMVERKWITWTIEIPTVEPHPENRLRAVLERVTDPEIRQRHLPSLDALEAARDATGRSAGDADRLDRAMGELEDSFTRSTGESPVRQAGAVYAGRTLVYEDCRRDLDLEIGPEVLRRLGPPLSLLLQAARWYTFTIGVKYEALFEQTYEEIRSGTGSPTVDLTAFQDRLRDQMGPDLFPESPTVQTPIVREVAAELRARWSDILHLPSDAPTLAFSFAELSASVDSKFPAPHPGWPMARYHSPDVLIAAKSADAIRRGEFTLVIGEVHAAMNTPLFPCLREQHPRPDELLRARCLDVPSVRISPVRPKQRFGQRTAVSWLAPDDLHVETGATRSDRHRGQVLAVGSLVVEKLGGRLRVRTVDDRHQFDVLPFFESYLTSVSTLHFSAFADFPHLPRVTIDGLVVCRERWTFAPKRLPFSGLATSFDRLAAARQWARDQGLPRRVFAKVSQERKPFYVDFDSSLYVDLLSKLARRASSVSISEMLPSLEDSWLADSRGDLYTCELRFAAVDPEPWAPFSPSGAPAGATGRDP